jgi:hypothetical protein
MDGGSLQHLAVVQGQGTSSVMGRARRLLTLAVMPARNLPDKRRASARGRLDGRTGRLLLLRHLKGDKEGKDQVLRL